MGVYTLTFAHLFLGEPDVLAAVAGLGDSGIDLNVAMSLGYASGAVASLTASMTGATPRTASVATERGRFDFAGVLPPPGAGHLDQPRRHRDGRGAADSATGSRTRRWR